MRTLLLALLATALGTTAAHAQEVRVVPMPRPADGGCVAPLAPTERARHAAEIRDSAGDGPAPVPMPNLCAEAAPSVVALDDAPGAPLRLDALPGSPRLDRLRGGPGVDRLRRRFDLDARPAPALPFAPVAPPDGRE